MGAVVGENDPLGNLLARGVRELFIVCSHPHRDHMSGLVSLIQDRRIAQLERVVFLDNDYERRTGRESLLTIYRKRSGFGPGPDGGDGPDGPDPDYRAVQGKLPIEPGGGGGMAIELYGGIRGADEHDRAIISAYTIREGDKANTVVDFDDASKDLIEEWSRETGLKPRTLVMSHHGSKYNYRTDILDAHPSVRDVVIPVNDANRYFHPSPEVLLDLVKRLGPEHVFITRSEPGANIKAVATGVSADGDNEARLSSFVALQLDRHAANLERLHEIADAKLTPIEARTAERASNPSLAVIERLVEKGEMTPQLGGRFRRSVTAMPLLAAVHDRAAPRPQKEEWQDDATAYRYAAAPSPRQGSNNGTPGYFTKQAELLGAAYGSGGAAIGSAGPEVGGGPTSSAGSIATGGGPAVSSTSGGGVPGPTGGGVPRVGGARVPQGPSGGGGGIMFRTALARPSPIFGGIILGNEAVTPEPNRLEFVEQVTPDGEDFLTIRVTMQDGRVGEYANFTAGELWSAYQFVQPTAGYLKNYPKAISNSAGLVGIDGKFDDGWKFVLHPAIADTTFASAAMRVDMFLAAVGGTEELPKYAQDLPKPTLLGRSWQWFDAPAEFMLDGERLVIEAGVEPKSCLMRVRVIEAKPPEWMDPADMKGSLQRESERRLKTEIIELFREINPDVAPPNELDNDAMLEWVTKAIEGASEEEMQEVAAFLLLKVWVIPVEIEAELAEEGPVSDADRMTPYIGSICKAYRPLRKINRLAKLIALLNWYQGKTGRVLPELPASAKPVKTTVPNWYSYERVL